MSTTTATELSDLFSMLHDGSIVSVEGTEEQLTLQVECQYLAELFQPDYYFFYVELVGISTCFFTPWQESELVTVGPAAALTVVIEAELEVMNAHVQGDKVIIICLNSGPRASISGGNLTISCQQVNLFDQGQRPLSLPILQRVVSNYWRSKSR